MAGLWELPGGEIGAKDEGKDRLAEILQDVVGLEIRDPAESIGHVEHLFSHRKLDLEVFRCRLSDPSNRTQRVVRSGYTAHRWVRASAILKLAHAGPTRKAMVLLGETDESSARNARRRES